MPFLAWVSCFRLLSDLMGLLRILGIAHGTTGVPNRGVENAAGSNGVCSGRNGRTELGGEREAAAPGLAGSDS